MRSGARSSERLSGDKHRCSSLPGSAFCGRRELGGVMELDASSWLARGEVRGVAKAVVEPSFGLIRPIGVAIVTI